MKAIVHIGIEKTGTTSIQKCMFENRRRLHRAGYHYIQSAGKKSHQALPSICLLDDSPDDFFRNHGIDTPQQRNAYRKKLTEAFAAEVDGLPAHIHTVLISSEHFHSRVRKEEEMDNVHRFLTGFFDEVRIICYLREQASACTSYYSTSLKSGSPLSFGEFARRCAPRNHYFNHQMMLSGWERCFGREALDVALFDRAQFINGDLLQDFVARISPELVEHIDVSTRVENESLLPAGQALARALNTVFPVADGRAEVTKLRNTCKKVVSNRLSGSGQQLPLRRRHKIEESFRDCNEQVRRMFFPDRDALFRPSGEFEETTIQMSEKFLQTYVAVLDLLRSQLGKRVTPQELDAFTEAVCTSWADIHSIDELDIQSSEYRQRHSQYANTLAQASRDAKKRLFRPPLWMIAMGHRIGDAFPSLRRG